MTRFFAVGPQKETGFLECVSRLNAPALDAPDRERLPACLVGWLRKLVIGARRVISLPVAS